MLHLTDTPMDRLRSQLHLPPMGQGNGLHAQTYAQDGHCQASLQQG